MRNLAVIDIGSNSVRLLLRADGAEKQMLEAGVQPLHFGNWVLRVETAAVCGLCLIHEMNRH